MGECLLARHGAEKMIRIQKIYEREIQGSCTPKNNTSGTMIVNGVELPDCDLYIMKVEGTFSVQAREKGGYWSVIDQDGQSYAYLQMDSTGTKSVSFHAASEIKASMTGLLSVRANANYDTTATIQGKQKFYGITLE